MTRESTMRVVRGAMKMMRRRRERGRNQYRHGFALRVTGGNGYGLCNPTHLW